MGAEAAIAIHHPDRRLAESLAALCVDEITRLERVFSLRRRDSALYALNRDGTLDRPPPELLAALDIARRLAVLSGGTFDATVQPLWRLYASYFSTADSDPAGPAAHEVTQAVGLVEDADVIVSAKRIAFARRGMAVTLNGMAQGLVTDRVASLLRAGGMTNVLIDLGETKALGNHPSGRPWLVGVVDPLDRGRIATAIRLHDRAVATSAGYGMAFDEARRHHHLFDARTGTSARNYLDVTVTAPDATAADALSTALAVCPPERARACLDAFDSATARLTRLDGSVIFMSSS